MSINQYPFSKDSNYSDGVFIVLYEDKKGVRTKERNRFLQGNRKNWIRKNPITENLITVMTLGQIEILAINSYIIVCTFSCLKSFGILDVFRTLY